MAILRGRSFLWFLEHHDGKTYRQTHQEVSQEAKHLAWRALIGVVIDNRLFPEIEQYPKVYTRFSTSSAPSKSKSRCNHFVEVSGKGQWLSHVDGDDILTFVCHHQPITFTIPLKAIVSYHSVGFPKVAYNVEQFLIAYLSILEWLDNPEIQMEMREAHACDIQSRLLVQNYPLPILNQLIPLVEAVRRGEILDDNTIQRLEHLMIADMRQQLVSQCKGMYHHAIEWDVDQTLLLKKHPLITAYLKLKTIYRNIEPGGAFVRVG